MGFVFYFYCCTYLTHAVMRSYIKFPNFFSLADAKWKQLNTTLTHMHLKSKACSIQMPL